jgi:hypothetical protein
MTLPLHSYSEHSCATMQALILFHLVIYIHFLYLRNSILTKLHCTLNSPSESLDHALTSLNHTERFQEIETGFCQSDRGGSETGGLWVTSNHDEEAHGGSESVFYSLV